MRTGYLVLASMALLLSVGPGEAIAKNLVVDDDLAQCPDAGFTTAAGIQLAVNAASPGDTIKVCAGSYSATNVDKSDLKLKGATKALKRQQCLDATAHPASDPTTDSVVHGGLATSAFTVTADDVTIHGFTVQDANNNAGIHLSSAGSGYDIRSNVVQLNTFGIYFNSNGVERSDVRKNCIRDNNVPGAAAGNGIYSDQGLFNAGIERNVFTGHENASIILLGQVAGSVAVASADVKIEHNAIIDDSSVIIANLKDSEINHNLSVASHGSGIFFGGDVRDVEVGHNRIVDCAFTGINLRFDPASYPVASPNVDNVVRNNNVTGCGDSGIRVRDGSNHNAVRNNKVANNGDDGIGLYNGDDNVVAHNKSKDNGRDGLFVDQDSAGNVLDDNRMQANADHDCDDQSTGTGTAGTANTWKKNKGDTQNRPGLCKGAVVTLPTVHLHP